MGAWIEILRKAMERKTDQVAPHVGAWIEILSITEIFSYGKVAPHVGAWIEICKAFDTIADNAGRTPRGCVD